MIDKTKPMELNYQFIEDIHCDFEDEQQELSPLKSF